MWPWERAFVNKPKVMSVFFGHNDGQAFVTFVLLSFYDGTTAAIFAALGSTLMAVALKYIRFRMNDGGAFAQYCILAN